MGGLEATIKQSFRSDIEASLPSPKEGDLFREFYIDKKVSAQTDLVKAVSKKAFAELSADIIGVWLFGPAAFGSLCEIASRADLDANPLKCENYPPWRYRLRLVSEALMKDIGCFDCEEAVEPTLMPFLAWMKNVTSTFASRKDMSEINTNPVTKEAYRIVEAHKKSLLERVPRAIPESVRTPYSLFERRKIVVQLVEKLDHNIPPNEYGSWPETKHAHLADILNAGWAFKHYKLAQEANWPSVENMQNLYRLILKAIEASNIHEVYGNKLKAIDIAES